VNADSFIGLGVNVLEASQYDPKGIEMSQCTSLLMKSLVSKLVIFKE
jgi:hypothetical protein